MSTLFNPNIPSNDDSVYDAYFSFHNNMLAINNLLDVDHISGTAPQYRGHHKQVTFVSPLDASPKPTDTLGVLYTGSSTKNPTSNAPVLKYANKDGDWEIPLGDTPGSGDSQYQGPPFYDYVKPGLGMGGWGYFRFGNKLAVIWVRDRVAIAGKDFPGETICYFPLKFKRVFCSMINYGTSPSSQTFPHIRDDKENMIPPNYNILITPQSQAIYFYNRNRTQAMTVQALIIGEEV